MNASQIMGASHEELMELLGKSKPHEVNSLANQFRRQPDILEKISNAILGLNGLNENGQPISELVSN